MPDIHTREGLQWWDEINNLPKYMFQLRNDDGVHSVVKVSVCGGLYIENYSAQEIVSAMQDEINELSLKNEQLNRHIHYSEIIPHGDRCENCPKSDPMITGNEGPLLTGYTGPYFCHLLERPIESGDKECGINTSSDESTGLEVRHEE